MKSSNLAPFIRVDKSALGSYYTDFFIALCGPLFMAAFLYGMRALLIVSFCLVTAVFLNAAEFLIFGNKPIINPDDLLTAVIIPMLCPAAINMLLPSLAVAVAVAVRIISRDVVKAQKRFICSAAAGWLLLAAVFPNEMFSYCSPEALSTFSLSVSNIAQGVPSVTSLLKSGDGKSFTLIGLLLGELTGPMGASAPIVLLACAAFLIIRNSAPYETVSGFIVSAFVFAVFFRRASGCTALAAALYEICGGSLMFTAVFIAVQRHFFPLTKSGRWICGVLMGILTMLLRHITPLEQAAPAAVLTVSIFCSDIDILVYRLSVWSKFLRVKRKNRGSQKK